MVRVRKIWVAFKHPLIIYLIKILHLCRRHVTSWRCEQTVLISYPNQEKLLAKACQKVIKSSCNMLHLLVTKRTSKMTVKKIIYFILNHDHEHFLNNSELNFIA